MDPTLPPVVLGLLEDGTSDLSLVVRALLNLSVNVWNQCLDMPIIPLFILLALIRKICDLLHIFK